MPLGLTDDQQALADALADWARDVATTDTVKAAEGKGADAFAEVWDGLTKLGVVSIAVPEEHGGAGGSFLDLACAVEACAAAMVPGPVLSTAVAATVLAEHADRSGVPELLAAIADGSCRVAVSFGPSDLSFGDGVSGEVAVLGDGAGATHLLVGTADRWVVLDATAAGVTVEPGESADLSRRAASVRLVDVPPAAELPLTADRVRAVALTLAAAEGARHRALVARDGGRLRQGPRAVRPARSGRSRRSSTSAPQMLEALRVGGCGRLGRRRGVRRGARPARLRRRRRGRGRARRRSRPTPRTASRCSAASASPGSTTPTSTCAAR